jgi:hypothetical protein
MALILWRNWIDEPGATIVASSEVTPATLLQDIRPRRAWHGASNSETLTVSFGAARPISHLALLAHNMTAGAQIGLTLTLSGESVWTDTVDAWDCVWGLGDEPADTSLGGYPPEAAENWGFPAQKIIATGPVWADGWNITLVDASVDHISVGRIFAGQGIDVVIDFGWSIQWQAGDDVTDTDGSAGARLGRRRRTVKARMPDLTQSAALGAWDDLQRVVGYARPVILQLLPEDDEVTRYRTTVYGLCDGLDALVAEASGFVTTLTVKEL